MRKFFFAAILFVFAATAAHAHAASFLLSPESGSYKVGDTISVRVLVDSEGDPINAVSGTVTYPTGVLTLVGASKSGSIVNFWTVEPSVEADTMRYEGVVLNPGYSGSRGTVATMTFRAKAAGTAVLSFRSAAILANDGLGTNVLAGTRGGAFTVTAKITTDEPVPVQTQPTTGGPTVMSSTHPDQNAWYKNNTPIISWEVPGTVTGVALLVDQKTDTNPGTHSLGRITGYNVAALTDGVWYAHVRFLTKSGWGAITHYRLGIDTTPPSELSVSEKKDNDMATGSFTLTSTDAGSGTDHYSFTVDDGKSTTIPISETWKTDVLSPGDHVLTAEVFDKAGNTLKVLYPFITTSVSAPVIDAFPTTLQSGETLTITGHTYPNTPVTLTIKEALESSYSFGTLMYRGEADTVSVKKTVVSNDAGVFSLTLDSQVESGVYTITAVATLGSYESDPSVSVTTVVSKSLPQRVVQFIMRFFDFLLPLALALVVIAYIVWRLTRRYYVYKRKMQGELVALDNTILSEAEALKQAPDGGAGAVHELEFLQKMDADVRSTVERTSYRSYRKDGNQ